MPTILRSASEPPTATAVRGWRYHHFGIPTQEARPKEVYLEHLKIHVSAFETSPCGVQWMRFDSDCPVPDIVKTVPHVAIEVDDLDTALRGQEVLIPPNSPSANVTVAMILDHGAPIELIQFHR